MDRRQRKTEEAISRALNQLLEEGRDINTISVRELTAAADITRSTFYLHYHDIPDLINSYLSEYLNNIASIIQKDYSQEPGKDRNLYLQLLKFMEDNHQRTSLVFSTRNYSSYSRFIEEGIVPYLEAKYHAYLPQADQKKLHTISVYTSRGTVGIILEWIAGGYQESGRQVAEEISGRQVAEEIIEAIEFYTRYFQDNF